MLSNNFQESLFFKVFAISALVVTDVLDDFGSFYKVYVVRSSFVHSPIQIIFIHLSKRCLGGSTGTCLKQEKPATYSRCFYIVMCTIDACNICYIFILHFTTLKEIHICVLTDSGIKLYT